LIVYIPGMFEGTRHWIVWWYKTLDCKNLWIVWLYTSLFAVSKSIKVFARQKWKNKNDCSVFPIMHFVV